MNTNKPPVVIVNAATATTAIHATLSYFRDGRYDKDDVKVIREWVPERCAQLGLETPDLAALDKVLEDEAPTT